MTTAYERKRSTEAARNADKSRSGRDIWPIPPIADIERRERCRLSLELFSKTYNPETFYLPWCDDHRQMAARIEEAATLGALYGFAFPRGQGKTTICRMAALWAISYHLRRYIFLIGATDKKAKDSLDAIKTFIRFLPDYAADFPEISYAVQKLAGISNRAAGQICDGESTMLEWSQDRIVIPTVPPPPNWPAKWELRSDGMVPTSGSVIAVSGLTGDGIRGSLVTLTTGESLRPDMVLCDDPQTPESAKSPEQNRTRLKLISADLLGLAGPGKRISCVMPCTVIETGDMVDTILDRKKHPLWRGQRSKLVRSMPKNMAAWDEYFVIYLECALREPPDFTEANELYLQRREILDEGAEVSWAERKEPNEISAIQSAMHIYCRDPRAFAAEYQNEPLLPEGNGIEEISPETFAKNITGLQAGLIPLWVNRLTSFIDVQGELLYWGVCGWKDGFSGCLVDYGAFPKQGRNYYRLRDANPTLSSVTGVAGEEARIFRGLSMLEEELLNRTWVQEGDSKRQIERLMVDANWQTETVKQWCRQSKHQAIVIPSHGTPVDSMKTRMDQWKLKPGERRGLNWIVSKHIKFDANFWKSFLRGRMSIAHPGKGSFAIYGDKRTDHRMLLEHLFSEKRERAHTDSITFDRWYLQPGYDNHFLDVIVGCAVGASMQGVSLSELEQAATARKHTSAADYAKKRDEFRRRTGL